MDYIKVVITVNDGDADILCASLSDVASGFEVDDPSVIDDFVNDKESRWDYIEEGLYDNPDRLPTVTFYLDDSEDGAAALERVRGIIGADGRYALKTEKVHSGDWENNWKQYYKPFKVGGRLYVRPSWETIDDDEGRHVLIMDPGSSFGTGSHATTGLCMEEIDATEWQGKHVLDMGCGSGILGCCAMLLGGESLVSCDIEEGAVKTAVQNLVDNGIQADRCIPVCGDVIQDEAVRRIVEENGRYDVILANIVADVLKAMCGFFCSWLKEDGKAVLSGIINERADEVAGFYEANGFNVTRREQSDGWTMLVDENKK